MTITLYALMAATILFISLLAWGAYSLRTWAKRMAEEDEIDGAK
jgi:hypothetical protein